MTIARANGSGDTPPTSTSPEGVRPSAAKKSSVSFEPDGGETLRPRDRWIRRLLPLFVGGLVRAPKFLIGPTARFASFLHRRTGGRDMRILAENLERVLGLPPESPEHQRLALAVTRHQAAQRVGDGPRHPASRQRAL